MALLPIIRYPDPLLRQPTEDVTQFDASVTGNTVLAARWTLFGKDGKKPLLMQESKISSAAANPKDYESVVAAMSRAVEALSREIAQAIRRRSSR